MLRWRFLLGAALIAVLVVLCWLDIAAPVPGLYLMPVALLAAVLGTQEFLALAAAAQLRPFKETVYGGNIFIVLALWLGANGLQAGPNVLSAKRDYWLPEEWIWGLIFFTLIPLLLAALVVLLGELRRYEKPGGNLANLAAGLFALVYVGLMLGFAVQLRVLWGVGALAAWIIVVKMCDTGAYFVGRMIGRHKLAPRLSPGKTIEGAIGGLAWACLGAWLAVRFLLPAIATEHFTPGPWWGWLGFGLVVGLAGMVGDLAESLMKRDVGVKDSSTWMPGFGGVLDILDSLLLSAPAAWFCAATGWLGRMN
jgi:phosphatidate cytidylyltransferase